MRAGRDGGDDHARGTAGSGYVPLDANGNGRPRMRIVQVIGALLIAGGFYVLIKPPTYSSDKSLFKVGQVEARVREDREIPPWAGGPCLPVGLLLIFAGAPPAPPQPPAYL